MFGKIHKEMNTFTFNIKTLEGHDELLTYMSTSIYASIKLLIFSSSTFSLLIKMVFPFIISLSILLLASSLGLFPSAVNALLLITFSLCVFTFVFIKNCKSFLISSIKTSKNKKEK